MGWLLVCKARLLALFQARRLEAELDEELEMHLELLIEENRRKGLPPQEARRAALLKLGGVEQTREAHREHRGLPRLESVARDLRLGLRILGKDRGFTAVVLVMLALGIGANTAVFQLLDALRLRHLPVPDPGALVEVRIAGGNRAMGVTLGPYAQMTGPLWRALADRQRALGGMFAWRTDWTYVGTPTEARRVRALTVSGDYFPTLEVRPWWGRLLAPADEGGACPAPVVVVSHAYWQEQLGGRPLDGPIRLMVDGTVRDVVGVTPPAFFGVAVGESFDVALPMCGPPQPRHLFDRSVMGRLNPGWTIESASAHLAALSPELFGSTTPDQYGAEVTARYQRFRLTATSAAAGVSRLRSDYDRPLWLLLGITGLVLLIACANLASLMLARAAAREREMAVRMALGAARGRLLQQLLVESALLAGGGAVLGLVLAGYLGQGLILVLSTESAQVVLSTETNRRVLTFAASVAALTCGLFGAIPALRATRAQPAGALKASGPGLSASGGRLSTQRVLVVGQIAVSLVLLFGALLFVTSFRNLIRFDPGLRQRGITVAFVDFERSGVPPERFADFERQLVEEVRALPGVLDAATTTHVPLLGSSWSHEFHLGGLRGGSRFTWVSPDYFRTLGIPIVAGRGFDGGDGPGDRRVAVVNRSFVDRFLRGTPPLGQSLTTVSEPGYPASTYQIVGVIPDTRYNSLRGPNEPMTFAPAAQVPVPRPGTKILIHSGLAPAALVEMVRRRLGRQHPDLTIRFVDFQKQIREGLLRERLMATVSGFFGLLAALLASVGIYGLTSFLVARRRKEIGIRVALGAGAGQTVGLLARETAALLIVGVVLRAGMSLLAARAARALLFGLAPHDPGTMIGAAALMTLIAAAATTIPARRAMRLSPMLALRED